MKTIIMLAIGLSLAGGAIAQAQPYGPGQTPPPAVRQDQARDARDMHDQADRGDRGDRGRHGPNWRRHHRGHKLCVWRHHQRVCHWRRW